MPDLDPATPHQTQPNEGAGEKTGRRTTKAIPAVAIGRRTRTGRADRKQAGSRRGGREPAYSMLNIEAGEGRLRLPFDPLAARRPRAAPPVVDRLVAGHREHVGAAICRRRAGRPSRRRVSAATSPPAAALRPDRPPSRPSAGAAARTGPTARTPPRPGSAPHAPAPPR